MEANEVREHTPNLLAVVVQTVCIVEYVRTLRQFDVWDHRIVVQFCRSTVSHSTQAAVPARVAA